MSGQDSILFKKIGRRLLVIKNPPNITVRRTFYIVLSFILILSVQLLESYKLSKSLLKLKINKRIRTKCTKKRD
jgi:hypothetical protein